MSFINWVKNRDNDLYCEFILQDEYGNENTESKKELVVLVGPPAVGKSTYIAQKFHPDDVFVVSRDEIVDRVSKDYDMTYDDMFALPPKDALPNTIVVGMEKYGNVQKAPLWMKWTPVVFDRVQEANDRINNLLQKRFSDAVNSDLNIVVDMTNMTASVRKNALKHADKKDYFKRAVVFTFQDSDLPELMRRMKERSDKIRKQGGSKTIGEDVVNRMIKSFETIDPKEGFDRVDTINTFSV